MNPSFTQSFSGKLPPNAIKIPNLTEYLYPGSSLFVHPDIGLVTSDLTMSEVDVANYWSNTIFTSSDEEDYSAVRPFARARLSYVAYTIRDYLSSISFEPHSICDFATGECVLPPIFRSLYPDATISVTEASSDLSTKAIDLGFDAHHCLLGCDQLPSFNVDIATLCWTLCNCINPLSVMNDIFKSVKPGGYLVIAESSRIMVPFKKSLHDLLSKVHPADVHPYHFSAHSLCLLGYLSGFKPVSMNRYYDSDVLTIIFKKVTPYLPDNLIMDSPTDILSFFANYVDYTRFFDDLNQTHANKA